MTPVLLTDEEWAFLIAHIRRTTTNADALRIAHAIHEQTR